MKTNIVMIARDRPKLTLQTIRTMAQGLREANLTIVDDGSEISLSDLVQAPEGMQILRLARPSGIVGLLKNHGIWFSGDYWGAGDYLYLSDNDVAFTPGWLEHMIGAMRAFPQFRVLGGYRHPYHGVNATHRALHSDCATGKKTQYVVEETDAVAGYSMLMHWTTWAEFGPFDAHAKGVCQSEDYAFCRKVVETGFKVGYISPAVIHNCGLTNTEGKPAIGAEHFPRIPGLIYE